MQKIQAFIGEELDKQKNNLFLWLPFCFAVGIALYFGLKFEPPLWISGLSSVTLFVTSFFLFYQRDKSFFKKLSFVSSVGCLLIATGFSIAQIRTNILYTPMLVKKIAPVGVTGTIESLEPLGGKDGSRVVLKELEIERLTRKETPRKIRLKIRKDEGLASGQIINVLAGLNVVITSIAK